MHNLDQIERWMQTLVMHPNGAAAGLHSHEAQQFFPGDDASLDSVILPSKDLSALERISIYADMYYSRLIEIVQNEFPTVRHILGQELFEKITTDYLIRHPSTHPNLNRLGSQFPRYLSEEVQDIPHRGFVIAVATVERAMEDVFDERRVERLPLEKLKEIPIENWGRMQLELTPALRLLKLDYPVNDFITAVRKNHHLDVPSSDLTCVAVYRVDYRAWRVDLSLAQYTLLSSLKDGLTLGEALEACAAIPNLETDDLAGALVKWFERWAAEGFFCGVR